MENNNNQSKASARQSHDPSKIDPTKKDERDNDATRIRPEKEKKEEPVTPPSTPSPGSTGVEEPVTHSPENPAVRNSPDAPQKAGTDKGKSSQAFG